MDTIFKMIDFVIKKIWQYILLSVRFYNKCDFIYIKDIILLSLVFQYISPTSTFFK